MCNSTSTSSRWSARLSVWPRNEANVGQYKFLRALLFILGNSFSVSLLLFQSWVVFTVACMSWAELTVSAHYWYRMASRSLQLTTSLFEQPKEIPSFPSSSPGAYVTGQTWETAAGKSTSPRRQHLKRPRGSWSVCQRQRGQCDFRLHANVTQIGKTCEWQTDSLSSIASIETHPASLTHT